MMAGGAVVGAQPRLPIIEGPVGNGGWLARWRSWVGPNASTQRGGPMPLNAAERLTTRQPAVVPFGTARYAVLPRYDWGAAGFSYDSGRVTYNPIGAGVVVYKKPPIMPTAVAQVVNGTSIFWNSQMINNGAQPTVGPLYDPATLEAMLGFNTVQAVAPAIPGSATPYPTSGVVG